MVIASLTWSLKIWLALMIKPSGTGEQKEQQAAIKKKFVGMKFSTFRDRVLMVPAPIIRCIRSVVFVSSFTVFRGSGCC